MSATPNRAALGTHAAVARPEGPRPWFRPRSRGRSGALALPASSFRFAPLFGREHRLSAGTTRPTRGVLCRSPRHVEADRSAEGSGRRKRRSRSRKEMNGPEGAASGIGSGQLAGISSLLSP
jgi:hypothetical protein